MKFLDEYMGRQPVAPLFVSQYVFPMYSYDPQTNSIVEETDIGFTMYKCMGLTLVWEFL